MMRKVLIAAVASVLWASPVWAQTKVEGKGGGKAVPPADKAEVKAPPPKEEPMQPQAPPPEVAAAAKNFKGAWRCKGTMSTPGGDVPLEGTLTWKLDPDKYWLMGEWKGKKTKQIPIVVRSPFQRTYDASQSKWLQFGITNMGSWSQMSSAGPDANGKTVWEGRGSMIGAKGQTVQIRETEEPGATAKEAKVMMEMSMDGKTWAKQWEVTCKR